jgi:hypothetical protein
MIISASYKTDIPAFYGTWFMNRLQAGCCKMVNPYSQQVIRVSLLPSEVNGLVFWTKNIGPFLPHLRTIRDGGFPFVVQYGINGYPRALECSVVHARQSVEHLRRISGDFGPRVGVWRYDPIVISSLTPVDFHRRNFEGLCRELRGVTDEVVISFVHSYRKTCRHMNQAAHTHGFQWDDPDNEVKRQLAGQLVAMARAYGMQLSVCSQGAYLVPGAANAHCIDAVRLGDIAGRPVSGVLRGGRKECGCYASRDIGEYDTCPHGCTYCYAVRDRELARQRFQAHDPTSEFLFPPPTLPSEVPDCPQAPGLTLFDPDTLSAKDR